MKTPPVAFRFELPLARIDWCGLHRDYLVDGEMEVIVGLLRSIDARSMLEIGCRDGRTAKVLLRNVPTLQRYVGVDVPPDYAPGLPHQAREMVDTPGQYAADDPRFELKILPRGSLDFPPGEIFDAVFIDGDHSTPVVESDSRLAKSQLGAGGLIIWHDYLNDQISDVRTVIDRLCDEGWPIKQVSGTWLAFCLLE